MKQDTVFAFPFALRPVAAVTLIAVVAWAFGLPAWIGSARAANVELFSDTLSDSDLNVESKHTIVFDTVAEMAGTETISITFDPLDEPSTFTVPAALDQDDIDITGVGVNYIGVAACGGGAGEIQFTSTASSTRVITFTVCTGDTIPLGTTLTIEVGTGVIGVDTFVTNPNAEGSFVIRLGGTNQNSGDTMIAIINDVTVTATVETTFTFVIAGTSTGAVVRPGTASITTTGTSSTTTLPFGVLNPDGSPHTLAQLLTVDTNAQNGFSVTVQADQTLTAGNLATIDPVVHGSSTDYADVWTWTAPSADIASTTTWGHWGLTTDDGTLSNAQVPYVGNDHYWVGNFINNPVEVFYYNQATRSVVGDVANLGVGHTNVVYQVAISPLQEAANDYTATLTYIATPVF